MYKVHVEIRQISLSYQAFNFWKAVSAQDDAVTSLLQPVIGKIPSSFVQLSGEPMQVTGIFYAGAETRSSIFIKLGDLPTLVTVPPRESANKQLLSSKFCKLHNHSSLVLDRLKRSFILFRKRRSNTFHTVAELLSANELSCAPMVE